MFQHTCIWCRGKFKSATKKSHTCPACKAINKAAHISRDQVLVTGVRIRPNRKVAPPRYDGGRAEIASGIRIINEAMGIGVSGPVRHLQPGDPDFARLATAYMVRDLGIPVEHIR